MLCPTPTRAARCTTASMPSSARATAAASRTSPTTSSMSSVRYAGRSPPCTCAVRLSSTRTRFPDASRRSARCEPMKPAPPVIRTCSDSRWLCETGGLTERIGLVGALPREVAVVAAEVAVRGGLRIDRAPQVEIAQDRGRPQVEVLAHELLDLRDGNRLRAERLDENRHRLRDADRIRDLHLAAIGEPGRDDILRDIARRIRGRAVDLRRVLARERAAAVRCSTAVRVDDDLAAGETGVAHRAADHELAGRVAVELEPVRVVHLLREDRLEHVREQVGLEQRL